MKPVIKIKKLAHFAGELPRYQSAEAAGCDVQAALIEPVIFKPGERGLVPTGMALEIPHGYEVQVRPRSGLALKNGVTLVNTPGTVDSDYRGELKIILINLGQEDFVVKNGDRIAQLVVSPVVQALFEEVGELAGSARGAGGFGSTGVGR